MKRKYEQPIAELVEFELSEKVMSLELASNGETIESVPVTEEDAEIW